MNLWLVDNYIYVIADGIAGAVYLSKGNKAKLVKKAVDTNFNPRLISEKEAHQIINGH